MPPGDVLGRWNHCMAGETHMWRKPCEAASADLAGDDAYANQVRIDRAVPFWGGISEGGCGYIVFHENKKCTTGEWVDAIRGGALGALLRRLNPRIKERPWRILCDGEHFLHSQDAHKACTSMHARHRLSMRLGHPPARARHMSGPALTCRGQLCPTAPPARAANTSQSRAARAR